MVVCKIFRGVGVFRKHNSIHAAAWAGVGWGVGFFYRSGGLIKEEVSGSIVYHPDA